MRYLVGFGLFLLAVGTLRLVGCGDDAVDTCSVEKCTTTKVYGCGPSERSEPPCWMEPINEGERCVADGVAGVCRNGVCGAPDLCEGVVCDDTDACTIDECAWNGMCSFTPIDCIDDNYCTEDWCDPAEGSCEHVAKPDGTGCGCWFGGGCEDGVCKCKPPVITF